MLYRKLGVFQDEVADNDGAGGAAKPAVPAADEQIALLTKSVGMIAEGLSRLEGNQNSIVETLAKITQQSPKEVKQELKEFGADVDLENMNRKDYAQFIMQHTAAALKTEMDKLLGDVDSKVTNLANSFEAKNATEQIAKAAENNADFWEWSGEIKKILQENPTLSVTRAYKIAKEESPTKAQELDKKYNKPIASKATDFFSLLPQSHVGGKETPGKMTRQDAALKAFDKVMGDLGNVVSNSDFKLA